jgi:hypothetical protein
MEFTAGDVREGWLPFRSRGGGTRVDDQGWLSHESRDWRWLQRVPEVSDEHSDDSARSVGDGWSVA